MAVSTFFYNPHTSPLFVLPLAQEAREESWFSHNQSECLHCVYLCHGCVCLSLTENTVYILSHDILILHKLAKYS